ncbi:MAG: Dabb family protein [Planctomycetes bacterium]|nr:Dabb family protein [Planctomycetota bacterium]
MAANVQAADPPIAHMVYFTLKDRTPEAREKLIAACQKYLSGHEGTVYFSAGVLAEEFKREVNDQDFDVALNLVFADKAAHDKYQDHPRHQKFIEENRETWAKVRVFDSYVKTQE